MARLLTSGFEYGSLTAEAAMCGYTVEGTWTAGTEYNWETSGQRSGRACLQLLNSGSTSTLPYLWPGSLATSESNTYYARIAVNVAAWPTTVGGTYGATGWRCLGIDDTSFLGPEFQIGKTGLLGVYNNGETTALNGTYQLALNTWYVLEMSWVPNTGAFVARVNGTQIMAGTAETADTPAISTYTCAMAGTGLSALVDDWAFNDSTGSSCNSWCGLGQTVLLTATADSSNTGFEAGTSSTTNLYDAINNLPPVGVAEASATTTSQITCNASSTTDNYVTTLETYIAAGIPSGATVVLVQPVTTMGGNSTTNMTAGLQSTANPVIAETTGTIGTTAVGIWPTNWTTLKAAITYSPTVTLSSTPTVEFRKGTASTNYLMSAFMGMLVEYVASVSDAPLPGGFFF